MTTKKSEKKVIKSKGAVHKSIDKPAEQTVSPAHRLRIKVKVQTAEGWKREMASKYPNKKLAKPPKTEKRED